MKLSDHVDIIRDKIYKSFNNQFSRLGIGPTKSVEIEKIPNELHTKRIKIDTLINNHIGETGGYLAAREKALDELTFTLFNRLAAIKVMEAHQLFPPIVTKQAENGDRSFGHKIWLEENPQKRNDELEGLRDYFKYEFNKLGDVIPLFHKNYPYAFIPYVIEFNEIVDAFNSVEIDANIETNIWQSDDILGWLYESYNNVKKQAHKDSENKTEYDKVSLQSQVYTPRWVVEFLVHNSLGKLYLEMYPNSEIKNNYKIANAPATSVREIKPLHQIKLIDPASGSGNFLLYAFVFFYALYIDVIENQGNPDNYEIEDIPKLIIENNLHGIDLDDRAIQLAQLGLWIKAKQKNRNIRVLQFNVVSSDFYLPDYQTVKHIFASNDKLDSAQISLIENIWSDLQQAHKFGSLVKIEEKIKHQVEELYNKKKRGEYDLFLSAEITKYEEFEKDFLKNLETAIKQYAQKQGISFLTDKTKDAITFLKLITIKYDIATVNPPYTDSADFGPELKAFIDDNYKKPYKFNTNLYVTFLKRSFELLNIDGFIAMIQPLTFMYIKTFEDVRKYILSKSNIEILVELGLGGVFAISNVQVYATMFVLKNTSKSKNSLFFDLKQYNNHSNKPQIFEDALTKYIKEGYEHHAYLIDQSKLKTIKSWPFIYWISDKFRIKFKSLAMDEVLKVRQGIATGDNNRCLRFWWEIDKNCISKEKNDGKKWVGYSKGGPYQKWHGNLWLVINFSNDGYKYLLNNGNHLPSKEHYFSEGLTYSASGSKGASFRYFPKNNVFDVGGSCIFPSVYKNIEFAIAFMNSKLCFYITSCLNPTVNTQVGDLKRVPFVIPKEEEEIVISMISKTNINITAYLKSFQIIEKDFMHSPFYYNSQELDFKKNIISFLNSENHLNAQILINETIINNKIFDVYELTKDDRDMIIKKEGENVGNLAVDKIAKHAYIENALNLFPLSNIQEFILKLPEKKFEESERDYIINEFENIYGGNSNMEEFCITHQINPINVWFWFKQSNIIPKQRMNDLAMEFLADMLREILMDDEDGIIPLVPNAGEMILLDRIEEKFIAKGFSMAQYSNFKSILGKELSDYIDQEFFGVFAFHLKLFKKLLATPFIWHLTSGPEQGFDCYIIIYKWNRDKLMRIRSVYIENRERALINRQSDLVNDTSASAQNEKDKIYKQLKEIETFKQKIDELLKEGYNPILDDGVGKNIAPLQKKKMLAYEVLNDGQLKKYLNADW
jgi:hypothetical protein